MVSRIPTGISGMDNLIEGGIPYNSAVTVTGATGCGKTILASQFIAEGIARKEHCKYISLEQRPEEIKEDAKEFGWDFTAAEEDGIVKVLYIPPFAKGNFVDRVMNELMDEDIDRVVIDPVSTILGYYEGNQYQMRNFFYKLVNRIKEMGTTALFTTEIPETAGNSALSRFNIEEFVVDGVITLYYSGMESGAFRSVEVRKMRRTDHTPGSYPFKIKRKKGIEVIDKKL